MTADAHVQAAGYSQSYNRYTYVFNNPLTGTDPSGFFAELLPLIGAHQSVTSGAIEDVLRNPGEIFNWYALEHSLPGRAALDKHVFSHDWGQAIGHIAIGVGSLFCTGAAPACFTAGEAHIAGYNAWLNGGDHDDVAEAFISAGSMAVISSAGNLAIGGTFPIKTAPISNILAHAVMGCAMGEASGGSCGAGALSRAITAAVDIGTQQGGVLDTGFWGNMAVSVASGCLASHAGGGTCEAGARSSAIIYLYNSQGGRKPSGAGSAAVSGEICKIACSLTTDNVGDASDAAIEARYSTKDLGDAPIKRYPENFYSGVWYGYYLRDELVTDIGFGVYEFGIKYIKPGSSSPSVDAYNWMQHGAAIGANNKTPIAAMKDSCGCVWFP